MAIPEKPESGTNVLALLKDVGERFVFLYDDDASSFAKLLATFAKYAADPEISFTWYDAAILSQRVRKTQKIDS